MSEKRFDISQASQFESRDGGITKGGLIRNGFTDVDGAGERWANMRPALATSIATIPGTGQGFFIIGSSLYPFVSGTAYTTNGGGGNGTLDALSTATGYPAVLSTWMYKINPEVQYTLRAPISSTLTFSTVGTTTLYSDNNKADMTQNDSYIIMGGGFSGVYEYNATQDGITWEQVDSGLSVRGGQIIGFGAGAYRFDSTVSGAGVVGHLEGVTSYTRPGTWTSVFGTQTSAFGSFAMSAPVISTANGAIWAWGTATWTGGTSPIMVAGSASGANFSWSLIGTMPPGTYANSFQTRFGWTGNRAVIAQGTGTNVAIPVFAIQANGSFSTIGTMSAFPGPSGIPLGIVTGGTRQFAFNLPRIGRFNIVSTGWSP